MCKVMPVALMTSLALASYLAFGSVESGSPSCPVSEVCLGSLQELTVAELRGRNFSSNIGVSESLAPADGSAATLMLNYNSGQLQLFARMDLPFTPPPESGYPLVVFSPGWISRGSAPGWDFGTRKASFTRDIVHGLVDSGFAVITAGYRGRGTVKNVAAQGIEFVDAWGNGSYLSPMFYAQDVLNLLAGLPALEQIEWSDWLRTEQPAPHFDLSRVSLSGHSQGGDVVLTALAILGKNRLFPQPLHAASIWSGNIPDRFTQANTFGPMGDSLQAFMSGDGTWTGTAVGRDGRRNPDFVFAWPADWIGTLDTASPEWTWQAKQWSAPSVRESLSKKYSEMYDTLNRYIHNMQDLEFKVLTDEDGATYIEHDPDVARLMPGIGGFHHVNYQATPLSLHVSDRDYYSLPEWNRDLASRITAAGGTANLYIYPGNTHGLRRSEHDWFSPPGTRDGFPIALARDIKLFSGARQSTHQTPSISETTP